MAGISWLMIQGSIKKMSVITIIATHISALFCDEGSSIMLVFDFDGDFFIKNSYLFGFKVRIGIQDNND